ncbi:C1q-like domain-containing protein [Brevibacillus reuszeri]|uniref:C1q-like domain-containing protein n=1 Tax=Brevibacillus reuszeri TaxID=54915 RepID=UPI00289D6217|nr:hypothetical protein [Brevibacillus reuszeri]
MTLPIKFKRGLKENLPSDALAGEPLFTTDTHELFMGTGDSVVPIAATDPELAKRVDELEQSRSTVTEMYTETFDGTGYVDLEKTTAVISANRARNAKIADFTEDFSNTKYFDAANSVNINYDTVSGKASLTPGKTNGILAVSPISTMYSNEVTIHAATTTPSTMAFSSDIKVTNDASISYVHPMGFTDRTNRTWIISFVKGSGIYAKVTNPDGSLAFEKFLLPFPSADYNPWTYQTAVGTQHSAFVIDYNNRVWFMTGVSLNLSSRKVLFGVVNSDGSTYRDWVEIDSVVASGAFLKATSLCVDKENNVWALYSYFSTKLMLQKYDSNGNQLLAPFEVPRATSGQFNTAKLLYDAPKHAIIAVYSTVNATYITKVSAIDGSTTLSQKTIDSNPIKEGWSALHDTDSDTIFIVGSLMSTAKPANALRLYKIDTATLNVLNTVTFETKPADRVSTIVKDGNTYRFNYEFTTTPGILRSMAVNASDLSIADEDTLISRDGRFPYLFRDSSGTLQTLYHPNWVSGKNSSVHLTSFVLTPTEIRFEVSNDNGGTWLPAILGQKVTFPSSSNLLHVRIIFTSPISTMSPELTRYNLVIGSSSGELIQELVSTQLPSVSPILHAILTADQTLNGGTIDWFVTNNGGTDWIPVTLGEQISFANPINSDLRVRSVLTSPDSSKTGPEIRKYTIISSDILHGTANSTEVESYSERFNTLTYVDTGNTSAIVSGGRIKIGPTPNFSEDFSSTANFDSINSIGVVIDSKARVVKNMPGTRNGVFYARPLHVPEMNRVTIDYTANEPSTHGFFTSERFTTDNTKNYAWAKGFVDRTNRTWRVAWYNGGIYAKVTNPDGTIAFDKTILLTNEVLPNIPAITSMDCMVDANNRVYFTYHGTAGAARLMIGSVNSDGSTYMNWTNIPMGSIAGIMHSHMTMDSQGRIWVWRAQNSQGRCVVINPDCSVAIPDFMFTTSSVSTVWSRYDSVRKNMVVMWFGGASLYVTQFNELGTVMKQVTLGSQYYSNTTVIGFEYDSLTDRFAIVHAGQITNSSPFELEILSFDPDTLTSTSPIKVPGITADYVSATGFVDNGVANFIYKSAKETAYKLISFKVSDLSIIDTTTVVTNQAGGHLIFRDSNGTVRSLASTLEYGGTNKQYKEYVYEGTKTSVALEISNDYGVNWHTVTSGDEIVFQDAGTLLNIRAKFDSPTEIISPELSGYSLTTGTLSGEIVQEFISTRIPSVTPIQKATLTAVETLNGGTIDWYMTNDGGATWLPVSLGQHVSFENTFHADLRVKAVLTMPPDAMYSPEIVEYTALSFNVTTKPRLSAFRATVAGAQSFDTQVNTKVNFNVEEYDLRDEYNSTTSTYVAKQSGLYMISSSVLTNSQNTSSNRQILYVCRNGAPTATLYNSMGGNSVSASGSTILHLKAGETVEIQLYSLQSISTLYRNSSPSTDHYFTISKIG